MTSPTRAVLERIYRLAPRGALLGLERVQAACATWGHPEQRFSAVHIAGTNGKGSVAAMTESIVRASGRRTGLYTSPHLARFAERIQIDGEPVSDELLTATLEEALDRFPELTFFETATVTAFSIFARANVDLAIVEVGLGGRLDATNVLKAPLVTAITRIALDHTDWLGPDLTSIAREKAGILKRGVTAVLGPLDPESRAEIEICAARVGAPLRPTADDARLAAFVAAHPPGLAGRHQADNAKIAVALAEELEISPGAIARGLAAARWPGRLETLSTQSGEVLLDAAHNPDGALALAEALATRGRDRTEVALVFGAMADKDAVAMLDLLAPHAAHRIYVVPEGRRATDPATLAARAPGHIAASVPDALSRARSGVGPRGLVVVAGSIFLVGAARAELLGLVRDPVVAL
ncbi:MAG: folylpolyglutamate synthase/dihydrofolate synthase family protein [Polyangiaceae bacterium]